jgi:hypothetical protein
MAETDQITIRGLVSNPAKPLDSFLRSTAARWWPGLSVMTWRENETIEGHNDTAAFNVGQAPM